MGHDVPQGGRPNADLAARLEDGIEVRLLQPEVGNRQVGTVVPAGANGVGLGEQVAAGPVGVDQIDHPKFLRPHRRFTRGRTRRPARLEGLLTIDALGEVETEEEMPPRRVHRIGVGEELPVLGLDGRRLGVAQMGMEVH